MERCKSCGGSMVFLGKGNYRCLYCDSLFSDVKPLSSKKENSIGSQGGSGDPGVDVFEKNINSVVEVYWTDGTVGSAGSGLMINDSGYVITNTHVVTKESGESYGTVAVKIAHKTVPGDVIKLGDAQHGLGPGIDLALVKLREVPADARPVVFEDFSNVKIGEKVFLFAKKIFT